MKRDPVCINIAGLLEQHLDGELTQDQTKEVQNHIGNCNSCASEFEGLKEINRLVSDGIFLEPQENFWNEQRQEIMSSITNLSPDNTVNIKPLKTESESKLQFLSSGKVKIAFSIAAAAVITLFVVKDLSIFTPEEITLTSDTEQLAAQIPVVPENQETTQAETTPPPVSKTKTEDPIVEQQTSKKDPIIPETKAEEEILVAEEPAKTTPLTNPTRASRPAIRITGASEPNMFGAISTKFKNAIYDDQVSIKSDPAQDEQIRSDLMRNTGADATISSVKLPTEFKIFSSPDEEYQGYLDNKQYIQTLETDLEKKNAWLKYFSVINDKTVFQLILDDLLGMYDKLVDANSPKLLKKESLDFLTGFEAFVKKNRGNDFYRERLAYLTDIQ